MKPKLSTIEHLPCELIVYIFRKIDLIDLLKLSVVCKRWSIIIKNELKFDELNIVDSKRIKELVNYNVNYSNSFMNNWFYLNEPYNYKYNLYYYQNRSIINSNLFRSLFKNLKKFNLNYELNDSNFDFTILNELEQLNQLEISCLELNKKIELKLNNLKTMAIYHVYLHRDLIIDAIKLKNFKCGSDFKRIKFKHPTIQYLEIDDASDLGDLKIFEDLKIINCLDSLATFNSQLNYLTNLKEFNLFDYYFSAYSKRELIDNLNSLINLKTIKSNLKISIQGIESINEQKINKIFYDRYFNYIFELDNYLSLIKLPWFKEIIINTEFRNLFDILDYKSLNRLIKFKLFNMQKLKVSFLDNNRITNLTYLLSKLNNLRIFNSFDSELDQYFYNQLPNLCPILINLIVALNRKRINYKLFLDKFKYLDKLKIDTNLNVDFIINYLNNNSHLHLINYFIEKKKILIERIDKDKLLTQ